LFKAVTRKFYSLDMRPGLETDNSLPSTIYIATSVYFHVPPFFFISDNCIYTTIVTVI